jgi:hypothetical protein
MKKKLSIFNLRPEIGMGITWSVGSDRYPGTIIDISASGKKITFQEDIAIRTDANGMSECQSYVFQTDPQGEIRTASFRKDNSWRITGTKTSVFLGKRDKYYDFSF